jgi:lysophospholipase L1-like esterase
MVFYDENKNGVLDPSEGGRLPNVGVSGGGHSAQTASGGVATLQAPSGPVTLSIAPDTLPAYYQAGPPANVTVPGQGQTLMSATLPIGDAQRRNVYMAFGDSITIGDGSSDGQGYRAQLEQRLRSYFGVGEIDNEGVEATRTQAGAQRMVTSLTNTRPAFTLIHYGTNDWNEADCRNNFPCYTIDSLRSMVRQTRAAGALPILATIIPCNVGYDARTPPERQQWLEMANALIREMAAQEGAVVADQFKAFMDAAKTTDLANLFDDHVHPNDAGYKIMSDTFFNAIAKGRPGTASSTLALVRVPGIGVMRPEEAAKLVHFPTEIPPDPVDSPTGRRR